MAEMRWEKERFAVINRVRETRRRWSMWERGDRVLVAVSGGGDSLVLLDAMAQLAGEDSLELSVLVVDHGVRPESAQEAEFVAGVAGHYGLECSVRKVDLGGRARGGTLSPEEAMREARYGAFREELEESGAARLATGHTADDRVETLLLRLITGAGPRGLGGVPPVRHPYIRPLIRVWRSEVQAYAACLPFAPRQDPTNLDLSIPRNRVRHRLIPFIEAEFNPAVKKVLLGEAEMLASLAEVLELLVEEAEKEDLEPSPTGEGFDVRSLRSRPLALRREAIARALRRMGLEPGFDLVEDIRRKLLEADGPGRLDLGPDLVARRVYGRLALGPRQAAEPPGEVEIEGEGVHALPHLGLELELRTQPRGEEDPRMAAPGPGCAWLDADRLSFPLRVRGIRPGDRFRPLGAPGERKIQDFLVDLKVPREERGRVAVLESGGEIAWVLGLRIDERFKVAEDTRRVAALRLSPLPERE